MNVKLSESPREPYEVLRTTRVLGERRKAPASQPELFKSSPRAG